MNNHFFVQRETCPTCSSQNHILVYRCDFTQAPVRDYIEKSYGTATSFNIEVLEGVDYALRQCQDCYLIFQEYVPSLAFMELLYEPWIHENADLNLEPNYDLGHYSRYSQDISQLLALLQKQPHSVKVLDFGMGWGCWALMAKAFGCDVYGIELSQQRMQYAQKNGIQIIAYDDLDRYKFDIINTDQVFEHLANPQEVLSRLAGSLNEQGLLKICVPNSFGIRYRLRAMDWNAPKGSRKSLNPVAPLEHINCFYRRSMLALAESVGLMETKVPLAIQYQYTAGWNSSRAFLRNLLMPPYRNILGLQNYFLFRAKTI